MGNFIKINIHNKSLSGIGISIHSFLSTSVPHVGELIYVSGEERQYRIIDVQWQLSEVSGEDCSGLAMANLIVELE